MKWLCTNLGLFHSVVHERSFEVLCRFNNREESGKIIQFWSFISVNIQWRNKIIHSRVRHGLLELTSVFLTNHKDLPTKMAASWHLQCAFLPQSTNCFVAIPSEVAHAVRLLNGGKETTVLRLDWLSRNGDQRQAYVGWRGKLCAESDAVYCDGKPVPRYGYSNILEIPIFLAQSIGFNEFFEDESQSLLSLCCTVIPTIARADKLELQPCSQADWEVCERFSRCSIIRCTFPFPLSLFIVVFHTNVMLLFIYIYFFIFFWLFILFLFV